jgi:hypothetical protein
LTSPNVYKQGCWASEPHQPKQVAKHESKIRKDQKKISRKIIEIYTKLG